MKRVFLILAVLVMVFSGKASAFVGGPFDNGDFSVTLDNNGIYQVAFRFTNGSGFAQFGNNVDTALFVDVNTGGGTGVRGSALSILNRSLIYYKGVTYLGSCFGMVDHERKIVQGTTNGNSDVSTSSTTTGTNGLTGQVNVTAATTTLNNNGGIGFPCNSEFRCKITNSHPILKFHGEGELMVINPSLGQVTLNAITAIINSATGANQGGTSVGLEIAVLVDAIAANAATIATLIPSAQAIQDNGDRQKMIVFGSRIFFINRR